jgi:hypothetical protein
MGLQLPEKSQDLATFVHTRLNNKMSCFRILCSDWVKLFARECLLVRERVGNDLLIVVLTLDHMVFRSTFLFLRKVLPIHLKPRSIVS